ncbi:carbohydrate ABC transporter permease [Blautia marasmi]|uniref:carbohydrate ABC transporter permease n=1 Tax=Blautia marasmi TaxID=1917868 RepID=UPI000CF2C83F|nr:sugar ABC transporter permease [Blautia marasmi]
MERVLSNKKHIAIFLLPAGLIFLSVMVVPILATGYYSLLDWNGIGEGTFVGLKNYVEIFVKNGHDFWQSFGHSIIVLLLSILVQEPIALLLALLLAKGVKGESFFRTAFFIPMVVSTIVIAQLFIKVYNPDYGLLNTFLRAIGLDSAARAWLAESGTALWAVMIPLVWQFIGYHMLLFYGAIKSISPDIIEAAKIDGANYFQISLKIILPLIMPVVETCIVIATVGSLKTFDFIYVMTNGGPLGATEVPSTLMYDLLMKRNVYGEGSTVATFIVVECLIITVILQKVFKKLRKA